MNLVALGTLLETLVKALVHTGAQFSHFARPPNRLPFGTHFATQIGCYFHQMISMTDLVFLEGVALPSVGPFLVEGWPRLLRYNPPGAL